jgi:hypothetical protein
MQSRMIAMILNRTTSSPDESLGSNLQWETVALSSARPFSTDCESNVIKPDKNMECNDDNAVEVIGPVDNGERMIAKNGERREVKDMSRMSKWRS